MEQVPYYYIGCSNYAYICYVRIIFVSLKLPRYGVICLAMAQFSLLYPDLLSYGTVFLSLLRIILVVFMFLRYGMICLVMAQFSLLVVRFP